MYVNTLIDFIYTTIFFNDFIIKFLFYLYLRKILFVVKIGFSL